MSWNTMTTTATPRPTLFEVHSTTKRQIRWNRYSLHGLKFYGPAQRSNRDMTYWTHLGNATTLRGARRLAKRWAKEPHIVKVIVVDRQELADKGIDHVSLQVAEQDRQDIYRTYGVTLKVEP